MMLEEVKKEIMAYLLTHEHARTSDIVFDLGIDPELVVEALNSLEAAGEIEGKALTG
jgi:DNA-binding MarR family transcriptional regulator